VAYVGVPADKNNSVAGIVNFMRNIGSSVGTSMVTTIIARRSQFHQFRLVQNARPDNPNFQNSMDGLKSLLIHSGVSGSAADAQAGALARIYTAVQAQAATLAYVDCFMVLAVAGGIMFFLAFFLGKNEPGGGHVIAE